MEGVHAGQRGEQIGGAGVAMGGGPGAEVLVDGSDPAAKAQARRDQAQWRRAADRALVVKPHTS
jgi:hypothetical protein